MKLSTLDPQSFPPIAYAFPAGSLLPDLRTFPRVHDDRMDRPAGGLWCSPIAARDDTGAPTGTAWTDWCLQSDDFREKGYLHPDRSPYDRIVTLGPLSGARIYRISTRANLDQLVREYPLPEVTFPLLHRSAPDGEALAGDGCDAVYASPRGSRPSPRSSRPPP
ncbi:hypothetical protein [Streptomyces pseudovenezuelae]|uniref:hypothetical protein n=1 Tax=Streptomyces pseudovenezuelae TaxID=67350 RepID=UPI002474F0EE|nr:hypothetical protein [Streptomyces pseudovenezuelae]